jgi:hypothetical protein
MDAVFMYQCCNCRPFFAYGTMLAFLLSTYELLNTCFRMDLHMKPVAYSILVASLTLGFLFAGASTASAQQESSQAQPSADAPPSAVEAEQNASSGWSGFVSAGAFALDLFDEEPHFGRGAGGFAAQAGATHKITDSQVLSVRAMGSARFCLDHTSGTCPHYAEISGLYGLGAGNRWVNASVQAGPSLGMIFWNHAMEDRSPSPTVGASAAAEAFFTPFEVFGLGVQVPATVNVHGLGWGVMLVLKAGDVW